jgi:sugar (pentulose or hexulose) kinase
MLALGIDIGTSGVRTAVLDRDGNMISMAKSPHVPQQSPELDANLWWDAVQTCLHAQAKALESTPWSMGHVTRIAVDGTSGTMVLTEGDLSPVGPALMYNSKGFDDEAELIAQHAPDPHITRGSNSALARAMRLVSKAERAPAHLLHQADFIAAKLMERGGNSDPNNSLKTGFDPETSEWPAWIGEVFNPELLPKVSPAGEVFANVSREIATQHGFATDAIVCAGTTDSIAAFLAGAPLEEGVAVTSLGSTLAIKMLSAKRVVDPAIGLYSHRIRDHWLVGGASNTGGAVLLNYFTPDELDRLSALIDPNRTTDLSYYPLLVPGERFPINDPTLAPKLAPRPPEDHLFLQGIFEGIAEIEARCYLAISEKTGSTPSHIFSAGGGAKNPVWTQIRARILRRPIGEMKFSEAAIGSAKVALLSETS